MKLSVALCMIVKNEEDVLDRCLNSVRGCVDEIIIVDTGSTDSTLAIAQKYTSKIYNYVWNNDFASARNYSLEQTQADYILMLDADEYLEENTDLQSELKGQKDFYLSKIRNFMSDGRTFSHSAIRLFKNESRLRYKNRLHEHLDIDHIEAQLTRGETKFIIQHTGYTNEAMIGKNKDNRNLPIMLAEVKENPTSYNLYNLAKLYMNFGEFEKAVKYFQQAYPGSKDKMYQSELLRKLAESLLQLERPEEALTIMYDTVKVYAEDATLMHILGRAYKASGYLKDAESAWLKCLEMNDEGAFSNEGITSYVSQYHLAELYQEQGELEKAYEYILKALQIKKDFAPILNKYFEIAYLINKSNDEVKAELSYMYKITQTSELQLLMDVLYTISHPLLQDYLTLYKIDVGLQIQAVAHQAFGEYELARDKWNLYSGSKAENTNDIITLSFLLKDESLLADLKDIINLAEKEYKLLRKLLTENSISIRNTSSQFQQLIISIFDKFIYLKEFDTFQTILNKLENQELPFKTQLGKLLFYHGYNEAAIDLLVPLYSQKKRDVDVNRLLGDICLNSGYMEDAQLFYFNLLEIAPVYSSYERVITLLRSTEDTTKEKAIVEEAQKKFPLSDWLMSEVDK